MKHYIDKNGSVYGYKPIGIDSREMTSVEFAEYQNQKNGWVDGLPELPDPNSPEAIQERLTATVQAHLDSKARERNYDNIFSACSYVASHNAKFAAEAAACVTWRDAVWAKYYELLDQALSVDITIPAPEELIAMLPVMEWPE